jgi:membrane protease subunit (stomatin/prohibitin family)
VADREIQYGASLTVRESQMAVFVNEGKVADVFGPGRYTLDTNTLPILTYLQNWDKLFQSPFKSDVYFFSTRQQIDQRWGTTQPVTIRDKDFGACGCAPSATTATASADPKLFYQQISGTRERYTAAELDGQLRALMLQHISDAVAGSGLAFLDLAANQVEFANQLRLATAPAFEALGLKLEMVTLQNVSLPEELQKILDQKIGMGMVGNDMGKFMQYQTAQSMPKFAESAGQGGIAGDAMGLGAGVALGQVMASQLSKGLQGASAQAAGAAASVGVKPDDVMATIEKLADLKAKGILTQEEFDSKKGGAAEEARVSIARALTRIPSLFGHRTGRLSAPTAPRARTAARRSSSARLPPPFAVCSFCKSTLVRDGEALRRTGESAELFDDHSPLQLGRGRQLPGCELTLVGRLQYRYNEGTWNEWHALFDSGQERLAEGGQRPLRDGVRRAAHRAGAARGTSRTGTAAGGRGAGVQRRLRHRRAAHRRAGRAAEAARRRPRLRRRRPAQHARRSRDARLRRSGAAGLVARPRGPRSASSR